MCLMNYIMLIYRGHPNIVHTFVLDTNKYKLKVQYIYVHN